MAIGINDLRVFCDQVIMRKNIAGRMPTRSFNSAVQSASLWLLLQNTDNSKEYQPGMKVSPLAYQVSKINTERLRHLLVQYYPIRTTAGGKYPLPSNYFYTSSVSIPYYVNPGDCETAEDYTLVPNLKEVKMVREDELRLVLSNALVRPNAEYPYGTWYDTYLQVYPTNTPVILLSYLKYPVVAEWVGTGPRDYVDAGGSTDLDWILFCFRDIAFKILTYMGVNIREGEIAQFATQMEVKGA